MKFSISLPLHREKLAQQAWILSQNRPWVDTGDYPWGVVDEICDLVQEHGAAEFVVSGFGESRWKLDVATDLAVVLTQILEVHSSVLRRQSCQLDFYEQGVERVVEFGFSGDVVTLRGYGGGWTPDPAVIEMSFADLSSQFGRFREEALYMLEAVYPPISETPWFQQWSRLAGT